SLLLLEEEATIRAKHGNGGDGGRIELVWVGVRFRKLEATIEQDDARYHARIVRRDLAPAPNAPARVRFPERKLRRVVGQPLAHVPSCQTIFNFSLPPATEAKEAIKVGGLIFGKERHRRSVDEFKACRDERCTAGQLRREHAPSLIEAEKVGV